MSAHSSKLPQMRILTAGRTSSERAAVAVARELNIPCAGRCSVSTRTAYLRCIARNARSADGTVVVTRHRFPLLRSPVMLAILRSPKPGLAGGMEVEITKKWIRRKRIRVLHITGHAPRRSTMQFLRAVFGEGIR